MRISDFVVTAKTPSACRPPLHVEGSDMTDVKADALMIDLRAKR